jgi:hypothetical protein
MRFQLARALALSLILQGGAFAQDVDNAVKDTGQASAKATKDAAHGTAEAADKDHRRYRPRGEEEWKGH